MKKIISLVLCVTLLSVMLPTTTFAENVVERNEVMTVDIDNESQKDVVSNNIEQNSINHQDDMNVLGEEIDVDIFVSEAVNNDEVEATDSIIVTESNSNTIVENSVTSLTLDESLDIDVSALPDEQETDGGLIGEGEEIDESELIELMYSSAYPTPDVSGMSQRDAIIAVALSQEGYTASGGTIYGQWFGLQDAWCAMFISWCAEKAGIPTSIIKKNAWAGRDPRGGAWSSCYYDGKYNNDFGVTMRLPSSGYIPQKGDIVWLDTDGVWSNGSDHVGLITGTNSDGSVIYTIEGNTTGSGSGSSLNGYKVMQKVRSVNKVHAYGVPNYSGAVAPYGYSISVSSNHITAGDKITLSYSSYDGVPCSAILYVYKNNSYYAEYQLGNYNGSEDSTATIQMVEPGQFQFFLKVYNDAGYFQGSLTNGCLTMTVDEKPVDRKLIMDVWMSDSAMGSKPNEFLAGKQYYLCYKLFDSYSGQYLNEFSNYSYNVTETLYELDGSVAGSYTYQNSDSNWIAMTRDEKGTYRGKVTLSGDISAEYELSFDIIYKPTISTPTNFVDLNLSTHKSTTLNVTVGGNLPGRYAVGASLNDDYAQLSWGSQSGMTFPLNITAKKAGTTSLSIMVYDIFDGKEEVVFTKIVSLTIKAPTYNVFFKALGASSVPDMQVKVLGSSLTLDDTIPTKTGYTFLGWSDVENATTAKYSPGGTYDLDKEVTLYAVWKANTYTVKYNGNGATSGSTASSTHTYDTSKALTANGFSKTGYTFLGWSTSSSATSATYSNQQSVKNLTSTNNDTVNLYAVWSKIPTYTITYNANGGSGAPASQTKTKDVALTLSSTKPTRSGYTFLGWSTSSTATTATYSAGGSYTDNSAATLYAVWKKENTVLKGDVNNDREVTFADAILILKHDAGLSTLSGDSFAAADVNGDGSADFADAILVLKFDAGLIDSL